MTQPPREIEGKPLLITAGLLMLAGLSCSIIGFIENPAPLTGPSYWAAETGTPVPTVTIFLGTSTPVYADTPVPVLITTTPEWTTVTPIFLSTPTPYWVTTTPIYLTETAPAPVITVPGLPQIGYTTPEPLATPYYRVGTFYMNSDVYVGGPDGLVFRIIDHQMQPSQHNDQAAYHFITVRVTNYSASAVIVPVSDVFFIRRIERDGELLHGRWAAQNEPIIASNLPAYETQQLTPLSPDEGREFILGFVLPNGTIRELGLITDWQRQVEGGLPIWFYLEDDPLGPFNDAYKPPPPTPVVLDEGGTQGSPGEPGNGSGLWPTTGFVTRGFGCHELYTGIDGSGFGCPSERPWFHNGVDIANSQGTLIWSPVAGTMLYAGPQSPGPDCSHIPGSQPPHEGLGNYQRVSGEGTLHYFGHLSGFLVTSGSVTAGQNVAEMGSTGCSTGSHLHWILYQNSNLVDPALWAGPGPSP